MAAFSPNEAQPLQCLDVAFHLEVIESAFSRDDLDRDRSLCGGLSEVLAVRHQ